jgi:hypothetical protein
MTRLTDKDEGGKRERPLRARWRSAILASELRAPARVVAFVLAEFMDAAGECFPSIARIGRAARLAPSTVRLAIEELRRERFLDVTRTTGGYAGDVRTRNHYRARFPVEGSESRTGPRAGAVRVSGATPPGLGRNASDSRLLTSPKNQSKEPGKTLPRSRRARGAAYTRDFEAFWSAYGYKVDKVRAFRAWEKVITGGADPEAIIAGARRYVAWIEAQADPPRRKYPEGWLSGRRWEDELPTPTGRGDWIEQDLRAGLHVIANPQEGGP